MKACLNLFIAGLTGLPAALLLTVYTEASAAICTPPPSGMVGWWRAEGNANDSADGNNGTIAGTGTVTYGPGLVGQALVLDGTHRDRVDLGNPTDLQLQNFTIEAWIKRSSPAVTSFDVLGADGSVSGDGAVILGSGRGGYGFGVANDGRIFISRIDLDGLFSAPLVTDTNWHHLAVTKSGSTAIFYLDGAPQSTSAYDHPAPYTFDDATCSCSAAIAIGSRGDARGGTFFGSIDEVAIYNHPLSATEIQAIYNAGSAGKCETPPVPLCTPAPSGIVGWWRAEGNANDSADGNSGTIDGTGTVSYGPGLVGQALVLDGTHRDRVNLGNPTDLQLQDFTIEAWIKRSSPTVTSFDVLGADGSVAGDGAVILGYGRGGYGFALANDGRMIISRIDLDGIYSAPLVTDTSWHHVAVTKSGSSAVFYLDGAPQATPVYDHPAPYTFDDATCSCSAAIAIGSRGDARGGTFFGSIDEVAIYNRPLSAGEIQSIYNAGSAGKCAIPPAPTIENLMELLDNATLPANSRRELRVTLQAAAASFERGQARSGINQLGAFQQKVRAQIARSNPVLAQELIDAAQGIINASGGR